MDVNLPLGTAAALYVSEDRSRDRVELLTGFPEQFLRLNDPRLFICPLLAIVQLAEPLVHHLSGQPAQFGLAGRCQDAGEQVSLWSNCAAKRGPLLLQLRQRLRHLLPSTNEIAFLRRRQLQRRPHDVRRPGLVDRPVIASPLEPVAVAAVLVAGEPGQ